MPVNSVSSYLSSHELDDQDSPTSTVWQTRKVSVCQRSGKIGDTILPILQSINHPDHTPRNMNREFKERSIPALTNPIELIKEVADLVDDIKEIVSDAKEGRWDEVVEDSIEILGDLAEIGEDLSDSSQETPKK